MNFFSSSSVGSTMYTFLKAKIDTLIRTSLMGKGLAFWGIYPNGIKKLYNLEYKI